MLNEVLAINLTDGPLDHVNLLAALNETRDLILNFYSNGTIYKLSFSQSG